jgi:hypothetical protein
MERISTPIIKLVLLLVFIISLSDNCFSQRNYKSNYRKKPKNSMAEGTAFVSWGYNRTAYTKSNINFVGTGYNFTLRGVKAVDRPSTKLSEYVSPDKITVPQFNFRAGYNFANYWNISIGYDHLKYVMVHGQEYLLDGKINSGIDPNWSGSYADEIVKTDESKFHYENTNGMNYIRAEITRVRNITRNNRDNFTISTLVGASTGMILSFNDFTFGGRKDMATISLSGVGLSAQAGLRFEFFKHFFLQSNVAMGVLLQNRVKTSPVDYSAYARQRFGYIEGNLVLGALFYIRPTNGCDSCPSWN